MNVLLRQPRKLKVDSFGVIVQVHSVQVTRMRVPSKTNSEGEQTLVAWAAQQLYHPPGG